MNQNMAHDNKLKQRIKYELNAIVIIHSSFPLLMIIIVFLMCSDNETHGGCTFLHLKTNIMNNAVLTKNMQNLPNI